MNALALQSFGFGAQIVRALDRDGSAWFVGIDVCAALELGNSSMALKRLEDDERDEVNIADPIGRQQLTTIISESGVYSLVFTSRKAAARQFRKWVTSEVLPTIRRTGRFDLASDGAVAAETRPANDIAVMADYTPALSVIREARQVFGRAAAQRLWGRLGLPEVVDRPGPAALYAVPQTIADWMQQCTRIDMAAHETAAALYASYRAWCDDMNATAETQTRFGMTLERMGYVRRANRLGRIERVGLKLLT